MYLKYFRAEKKFSKLPKWSFHDILLSQLIEVEEANYASHELLRALDLDIGFVCFFCWWNGRRLESHNKCSIIIVNLW